MPKIFHKIFITICWFSLLFTKALTQVSNDTLKPASEQSFIEIKKTKNPTTAILLSIFPGGGQIYNEQYWKAPIFMVSVGYFVYSSLSANSLMQQYAANKTQRDFYRNSRDANILIGLGVLGLGMIDAYSGANLFSFDVDDKLTDNLTLKINFACKF